MADSVERFSSRVENYAKYRPGYPAAIIDLLKSECGLTTESVVADVGSGTGKLAEIFLKHGNTVYGVEPNAMMRRAAEELLKAYSGFVSVTGRAEATTLEEGCTDLVTAGQAFHWFDRKMARKEFARISKKAGWVALVWNERKLDATPFLRDYENLMLRYGTDYQDIRHENATAEIDGFFGSSGFAVARFDNLQLFDFEGLRGRVLSSSYTPEPGLPAFTPMMDQLHEVFANHESNGIVTFEYDTRVYYGRVS